MRHILLLVPAIAAALVLSGCKSHPINANLTDAELNAKLEASFHPGMPLPQIESELDKLNVSRKYRHLYPGDPAAGTQHRLLARVFGPGGFWVDSGVSTVNWVDINFNLSPGDQLTTMDTVRGGLRYVNGQPYAPLPYETLYPLENFPNPPPPPAR